jgi:hypothetical protein
VDKLFFALDTAKVVVDVEKVVERDEALLKSTWEDFYVQWCGKECLVKWLDLKLDEEQKMEVVQNDDGIVVNYAGKEYPVQVSIEEGYVYAVMK